MTTRNKIEHTPIAAHRNVKHIYSMIIFLMLPFLLGSCEAVAGIFKAGMGLGILLVVAFIVTIVVLFMRMGKNKNP